MLMFFSLIVLLLDIPDNLIIFIMLFVLLILIDTRVRIRL
jgi:hypothetical protein